jgi:hypothetical protein
MRHRISREEFLQFLQECPGVKVNLEKNYDNPYFNDAYFENPYENPERSAYVNLRFIAGEDIEKCERDGTIYDAEFSLQLSAEQLSRDYSHKTESVVYIHFNGGPFIDGDSEGYLVARFLVLKLAKRWPGILWDEYYNGDEPEEALPRHIPVQLNAPAVTRPPSFPQEELIGSKSTDLLFFSECIDLDDFREFMRSLPGVFVPDDTFRAANNPLYHAYFEVPDPDPKFSFPIYVAFKCVLVDHVEELLRGEASWYFASYYKTFQEENAVPKRVTELLGSPPQMLIEVMFDSGRNMLAHQFMCAIMKRWPCVYDAEVRSNFYTFTAEEVCKAVRHGVHAYYVRMWPEALPPEIPDGPLVPAPCTSSASSSPHPQMGGRATDIFRSAGSAGQAQARFA